MEVNTKSEIDWWTRTTCVLMASAINSSYWDLFTGVNHMFGPRACVAFHGVSGTKNRPNTFIGDGPIPTRMSASASYIHGLTKTRSEEIESARANSFRPPSHYHSNPAKTKKRKCWNAEPLFILDLRPVCSNTNNNNPTYTLLLTTPRGTTGFS